MFQIFLTVLLLGIGFINGEEQQVLDLDVMMFQVGEFGQLASNDGIRATEHRVHRG